MKKNTRIIISIIGLVFMLAFTVLTVVSLFDMNALGGSVVYLAIASGLIGIISYFLIKHDNKAKQHEEELKQAEAENAKEILENSSQK